MHAIKRSVTLCFLSIFLCFAACSASQDEEIDAAVESLRFSLQDLQVDYLLPGRQLEVIGEGFLEQATYRAQLEGQVNDQAVSVELPIAYRDYQTLLLQFSSEFSQQEGDLNAVLRVQMSTGGKNGEAECALKGRWVKELKPSILSVDNEIYPATAISLRGEKFLNPDEGHLSFELKGQFQSQATGAIEEISGTQIPGEQTNREQAKLILNPQVMGIQPGRFKGQLRAVNEGSGWSQAGDWFDVDWTLKAPQIEYYTESASRGQKILISGAGFLGGDWGGVTTVTLKGEFQGKDKRQLIEKELSPDWLNGQLLQTEMEVEFDDDCQSDDLGAQAGWVSGTLLPSIEWNGQQVKGEAVSLEFEVLPPKQVIWLRFLPAFTDSLRIFGLRNFSLEIKNRIAEVVNRDYEGINLEIRLTEPEDFARYAIVEIGGPDPNAQNYFGLDSTPGFDDCNARLDDHLAGANWDGGGYGGIFVESFLQLSPKYAIAETPLTHPKFDEIFDIFMQQPAETDELNGPRKDELELAIRVLGNLVGNTVTHEVGHTLGLTREPGCGLYHNAPGDFQIMDCGVDRPFLERAELVEGFEGRPAVWLPENREYLEMILPMQ